MSFVVTMAERLVDDPAGEARTLDQACTQLPMVMVGVLNWRSRDDAQEPGRGTTGRTVTSGIVASRGRSSTWRMVSTTVSTPIHRDES